MCQRAPSPIPLLQVCRDFHELSGYQISWLMSQFALTHFPPGELNLMLPGPPTAQVMCSNALLTDVSTELHF